MLSEKTGAVCEAVVVYVTVQSSLPWLLVALIVIVPLPVVVGVPAIILNV